MITSLTKIADERVINEIMLLIDGAIIHAQMGVETDAVSTVITRSEQLMEISFSGGVTAVTPAPQ
jgi:hypothetical protein